MMSPVQVITMELPRIQPVDHQLQHMLDQFNGSGQKRLEDMTPLEARKLQQELFKSDPAPIPVASIENHEVPVERGVIVCRVYDPDPLTPLPILVYMHGGGWVLGDLDGADSGVRRLAVDCGCVVVSVGYRLAPEVPVSDSAE